MKKILAFIFILISSMKISFSQDDPDAGKIYTVVDEMPVFPRGEQGMMQYLSSNIRYPRLAFENRIQGIVYVTFVVDTAGRVTDPRLLRGVTGLDEEALRVVSSMPAWSPGRQNGKKVNVQYNLPINFTLKNTYTKPLTSDDTKFKKYYAEGNKYFAAGDFEKAIKSFTEALGEISDMDSYYNRGVSYKKLGNDNAACNDWQKAKELGDKESEKLLLKYCGTKEDTTKIIEVMPEFPGGKEEALLKYIKTNLKYPKEAREKNIEGIVYVSFIVNNMGKVQDPKILKGIGNGCDEEALRLVNSMPDWKPGTQNGRPVSVQYNLPIKFEL